MTYDDDEYDDFDGYGDFGGRFRHADAYRGVPRRQIPCPMINDYERALIGHRFDDMSELRELAVHGARVGSMGKSDILRRVRPAAVAVSLLAEPDLAHSIGAELVRTITRHAGDHPERWSHLITRVESWPDSLYALLKGKVKAPRERRLPQLARWVDPIWHAPNILLALAPRPAARHFLATGANAALSVLAEEHAAGVTRAGSAQRMAARAPLCRELVEHALGRYGSRRMRLHLAANPYTPDRVLARLMVTGRDQPNIYQAIRTHQFASGPIRRAAFMAVRNDLAKTLSSLSTLLPAGEGRFVELLAAMTEDDAPWAHHLLKEANFWLGDDARRSCYALLARLCGLETVWAMDLERVGSLDKMLPLVRASMADGSAAPLYEAALARPYREPGAEAVASAQEARREELLDRPMPWLL